MHGVPDVEEGGVVKGPFFGPEEVVGLSFVVGAVVQEGEGVVFGSRGRCGVVG